MLDISSLLHETLAGRYVLKREIGRGGAATVYLAHDVRHERLVAIKVLHPELSHALGAQRFLREIKLTASLQHPHILPIHDSGEAH
ncbi:MAG: protein kinase, partial [bacterium]